MELLDANLAALAPYILYRSMPTTFYRSISFYNMVSIAFINDSSGVSASYPTHLEGFGQSAQAHDRSSIYTCASPTDVFSILITRAATDEH